MALTKVLSWNKLGTGVGGKIITSALRNSKYLQQALQF